MISPMVLLGLFAVAATPILPAEPLLIGLGTLAAAAHECPLLLIATGAVGCAVSDHLLYLFGRVAGTPMLARIGRRRSIAGLVRQFDRWGMAVLVAGRWVPGGGTVAAVLAGTTHRRLRWFTPASILGSSVWATYATLLGYAGGALTQQPVVGAAISLASAAILTCAIRLVSARHARAATEA